MSFSPWPHIAINILLRLWRRNPVAVKTTTRRASANTPQVGSRSITRILKRAASTKISSFTVMTTTAIRVSACGRSPFYPRARTRGRFPPKHRSRKFNTFVAAMMHQTLRTKRRRSLRRRVTATLQLRAASVEFCRWPTLCVRFFTGAPPAATATTMEEREMP